MSVDLDTVMLKTPWGKRAIFIYWAMLAACAALVIISVQLQNPASRIATLALPVGAVVLSLYSWTWPMMVRRSIRTRALASPEKFQSLYEGGMIRVRANPSAKLLAFPDDWREAIAP